MPATPVIAKSAPKLEEGGSGVAGMPPAPLLGVEHPQGWVLARAPLDTCTRAAAEVHGEGLGEARRGCASEVGPWSRSPAGATVAGPGFLSLPRARVGSRFGLVFLPWGWGAGVPPIVGLRCTTTSLQSGSHPYNVGTWEGAGLL